MKGVSKVGHVLYTIGSPMGAGVSYSHQWLRDGVAIEGAVDRKYVLTPDDLGATMSLRVCGSKYLYETTCVVGVHANVVALGELSRRSTVSLTSTSNKVGVVLQGRTNSWDADVELSYSWLRDGVEIEGEYETTYQLTDDDRKHSISFKVLAQKPGYKDVSKTSRAKRIP
jgi:serine protease